MSNIKFYIYGVPDGFNMLSGTHDEILYYQLFYDTSKKGTEMRINRKANGETIYSYLKYNLVSCKGREGSFLGMSVAFHDFEYCDNPEKLKELFEAVYNNVILKADDNDKIVAKVDGGNAVGRFCMSKFAERQTMCEKVGRIVIQNVVGELKKYIKRWNESGESIKVGCLLELPFDSDSSKIIQALRSYSWVSVSTGYIIDPSGTPKPDNEKLAVHYINGIAGKVTAYKDFIIQGLKGLVSPIEISEKREEVNSLLDTIEKYAGKQPELLPLREQYIAIYKEIVNLPGTGTGAGAGTNPTPKAKPKPSPQKPPLRIGHIAMACCAVVVIACLGRLWTNDTEPVQPKITEEITPIDSTSNVDKHQQFDFSIYYQHIDKHEYASAAKMILACHDDSIQNALKETLQKRLNSWFTDELKRCDKKLSDLQQLRDKLNSYSMFDSQKESHQQQVRAAIAEASGEQKATAKSSNDKTNAVPTQHVFYKADDYYNKLESIPLEANNTITCKTGDYIVVNCDSTRYSSSDHTNKDFRINQGPDGKSLHINSTKIGLFKLTFDGVTYTFRVKA